MLKFLKYLLAVVAGGIITTIVVILTFKLVISIMISSATSDKAFTPGPNSVYHIKLNKQIVERSQFNPLEEFEFFQRFEQQTIGLNDIISNIEKAAKDENMKGIFLEIGFIQAGMASVSDIRNALKKFKGTGKFVIAYGDFFDKKAYFLATVANEVYLNPLGAIEFTGLKSEISFFKGTFDKLGIEPIVVKAGKFKSFGERYDSYDLSPENKTQISDFLNGIWKNMLNEISVSRNIKSEELNRIADELGSDLPDKIMENKLVDGLLYKDQVIDIIKGKCNLSTTEKIKLVKHNQLRKADIKLKNEESSAKIAVVYAWGDVIMGNGEEGKIGAERISKAIKKAREDHHVKAVVLRVNSGGGSALASEVIWRELELTRQEKPVIASFGDIAASGGYYISVPADTIVASPYTLTGSIGVIGLLFNAEEFFEDKLGITHRVVKTNEHADFGSIFRKMGPAEKESLENAINTIYHNFVGHVAEGRNRSYNQIDAVAQGRIWNAADAKEKSLIDEFGGLNDAIAIAADKAGLLNYDIVELPELKSPVENFFKDIAEQVKQKNIKEELGAAYPYYEELNTLINSGKYQAINPYNIEIE